MLRALILWAAAWCVHAGTIQGVVLEHASGRPLARSVVRLDPVPQPSGNRAQALTLRVGLGGNFTFPTVAPGVYLLTATHDGYFPGGFGQRVPLGHPSPIEVTRESTLFAEMRLRHKGAVTGRILDENGVGTAGVPVLAYRARLPLRSAGSAVSDDRGMFRIPGLEAGKYWVRSGAYTMVDGTGWLPTFGNVAREVREARVHQVIYDADTAFADISPEPGALYRLSGPISCGAVGTLIVTLSSETGRRRMETECAAPGYQTGYQFDGLAPANYEVFAAIENGSASGFTEVRLEHEMKGVSLRVAPASAVEFDVRRADIPITLLGRRQNLADTEAEHEIPMPQAVLAPGHWEMHARVPPGYYVESIAVLAGSPRRAWTVEHSADWFEVYIDGRYSRVRIAVSDHAGQIAGTVRTADGKPASGAPVFLWPVAEAARRSLNGTVQTLCDTEGRFRFDSLPPGDYRVLGSFDVGEIDEDLIEQSRAAAVHAGAGQPANIDLTLWVALVETKLAGIFDGWNGYQTSLLHAVSPLTAPQLAWRPAADRRSAGELIRHLSLGRITWLARMSTPGMEEVIARVPEWFTDGDGARHVAEGAVSSDQAAGLVEWLEISWKPIERALEEWTVDDLFCTYRHRFRGNEYDVSRQWTLWRIMAHDIHHGGQLALLLALQGVEAFELRGLGGHIVSPPRADDPV